jgi:hypothetical protein
VLSTDEQKAVGELRRHPEHLGSARPPRSGRKTPLAFVVLWWISVLTVIAGAILPGMGMAAAVGLGWLLWRYLPTSEGMSEAAPGVADDGDDRDPS